jgi:hypothetical protein
MRSARASRQAAITIRRQHRLHDADRRQLVQQLRLEAGELGGILLRQHDVLLRAQAVPERIPRRARLALRGPGATRFRTIAPAGFGAGLARCGWSARRRAGGGHGRGARDAGDGHGGVPCWWGDDGRPAGAGNTGPQ